MYFFLFDSFLQESKYRSELAKIEGRIASLGLTGRTEKITILKNIREAAERAIERGATTVVAVGNDQTITKILPAVASAKVTLGHIPIGTPHVVGDILGLPAGAAATDDLSRRIIAKIDLGRAGGHFFLLSATLPASVAISCDSAYTVTAIEPEAVIEAVNLGSDAYLGRPDDGRLEVVIHGSGKKRGLFGGRQSAASVFPVKHMKLAYAGPEAIITLDGTTVLKTPLTIEAVPQKLSVIVGSKRKF